MLPYGVFNIFLLFADIFIVLVGILGILLSIGKVANEKLWSLFHGGASLFGVPAICFMLFLQWTTEFSAHNIFIFLLTIGSTTVTTTTQAQALTYINPSFAVIFNLVLLGLAVFNGFTAVGHLKEIMPEVFGSSSKSSGANV
ncbi:predicted protein [Naegleria gruberi]|uniref:Predicted protein n=1 Tax=Naegleria gruberi TaxID=5762 RepID=D2VGC2_NAEGR|nr:uncharacterized protein NAEGRDRAFT_67926 [Naegleria gruberi]EFC44041.1 predicted protein [Naegleria gruberi]|eukprot:XP_002676785.1 predicted protein [Naegleria gruberi strain NEG-M]